MLWVSENVLSFRYECSTPAVCIIVYIFCCMWLCSATCSTWKLCAWLCLPPLVLPGIACCMNVCGPLLTSVESPCITYCTLSVVTQFVTEVRLWKSLITYLMRISIFLIHFISFVLICLLLCTSVPHCVLHSHYVHFHHPSLIHSRLKLITCTNYLLP